MPREHQIPGDFFKGDNVKAVVVAVELRNNTLASSYLVRLLNSLSACLNRRFQKFTTALLRSRKSFVLLERAKVAVESYDDRVDPVGVCVGMKGSRIHSIAELRNENIDVINFTNKSTAGALSPAVTSIT